MNKQYIAGAMLCFSVFTACDVLSPSEVQNPNVVESDFVNSPDAMASWVNGSNARFAAGLSALCENLGIASDDMSNNSSLSNKTWDKLEIYYTDGEINEISTHLGEMIQMADFGLEKLAPQDASATKAQCFNLYYIKACALLMAGENFVALPESADGKVLTSNGLLNKALSVLEESEDYANSDQEKALVRLLQARTYRSLEQWTEAASAAQQSLTLDDDLLYQTQYDDVNGVPNTVQEYISLDLFSIPTRLSVQKAKFPQSDYYNQPLCFAKSEEAWLILAEEATLQGNLSASITDLQHLDSLVRTRSTAVSIASVPTDSALQSASQQEMLVTVYQMRQEVFFGEGRRASDLGIRLPISEVEFHERGNLPQNYTQVLLPSYLTFGQAPDDIENLNLLLAAEKVVR